MELMAVEEEVCFVERERKEFADVKEIELAANK